VHARKLPPAQPLRLEAALSGLLALNVARLEHDQVELTRKMEVVLADAGLTAEEIASVTGKSVGAIRKAIERARK
jgi:DNA-directed RNA polymerase specialized sigma24 family protein